MTSPDDMSKRAEQVLHRLDQIDRRMSELEGRMTPTPSNEYRQIEAYIQLTTLLGVTGILPPTRGFASSPDLLLYLTRVVRQSKPRLIVECGSGVSTVVLAAALRRFGVDGRVVSLEHSAKYARLTETWLLEAGIEDGVEVRQAPLTPVTLEDDELSGPWRWYDEETYADLRDIDLLFVDGPPASAGAYARFPALPLMRHRIAPSGRLVLDDSDRPDESAVLDRWSSLFLELTVEQLQMEKGCGVLTAPPLDP